MSRIGSLVITNPNGYRSNQFPYNGTASLNKATIEEESALFAFVTSVNFVVSRQDVLGVSSVNTTKLTSWNFDNETLSWEALANVSFSADSQASSSHPAICDIYGDIYADVTCFLTSN